MTDRHSTTYRAAPNRQHTIALSRELAEALDELLYEASLEREQLADDDPFAVAFDAVDRLHDCRRIKLGGAKR